MMDTKQGILKFIEETGLPLGECAELYTVFLKELHDECDALQSAMQEENLELSGRIVHNIKGITGNYKMEALHQIAVELDLCYKKQRTADIPPLLQKLLNQVPMIDTELRQFFGEKGLTLCIE